MTNYVSVGPIRIDGLETLQYSTRKIYEIVNIPFGRTFQNSIGVEMVGYQISGSIFDTSQTIDPRNVRKQLTHLFHNHTWEPVYIYFNEDGNELNGWFLLDSFSASITPGTFHYSFSMNVRRLISDGGLITALYAADDIPLTNTFTSLTPQRWVAMPKGLGETIHNIRTGDDGTTRIVIDTPSYTIPYNWNTTLNDFKCSVYYTTLKGFAENNTRILPSAEVGYVRYYGLGNDFHGDVYISNGLIRCVYLDPTSGTAPNYGRYHWDMYIGGYWERVSTELTGPFQLTDSSIRAADIPPQITYFDQYRIEFIQYYNVARRATSIGVKNILRYGTYFVEREAIFRNITPTGLLYSTYTGGGTEETDTITANYMSSKNTAPGGSQYNVGLFFTDAPSGTIVFGGLGLATFSLSVNSRIKWGYFMVPNPAPTGATMATLGLEFLSNSNQRTVLVNPRFV